MSDFTKCLRGVMGAIAGGLAVVALPACTTPAVEVAEVQSPYVVGAWSGSLTTPVGALTIVTRFEETAAGIKGTLESVNQAPGQLIPMSAVNFEGDTLIFEIALVGGAFEGTWDPRAGRWTGLFTQGGQVLPLTLDPGLPPPPPLIEGLDGRWDATVTRNGVDLRLVLRVETKDGSTLVLFDAPDFAARGLGVSNFARQGDRVCFDVTALPASFDGILSGDGATLTGDWQFQGQPPATVTFRRSGQTATQEAPNRPQYPEPPLPYVAEEVSFDNPMGEDVVLSGTLTKPEGAGPFPAAVLITGSGPQDRDQTVFGHKTFLVLSDYLTRRGYAVLRYDDRGVAGSTGEFASATSLDFAHDANAAVRFLAGRDDIDARAIGLIGHSEGGVVGPIATGMNDDVDFLVMLAGVGTDFSDLLIAQQRLIGLSTGTDEARLDRMEEVARGAHRIIRSSDTRQVAELRLSTYLTPARLEVLGAVPEQKPLVINQLTNDWIRYILKYDAPATLAKVDVPVLAMNGDKDLQVPVENLSAIEAALAHNPDVTIVRLEGLNHMFQTAQTGALGEYADIEETIAPVALGIIGDWLDARFLGE